MTSVRTCVACGARAAKPELRRFVRVAEALRFDPTQCAPGRGAYLHRDAACVRRFGQGRGPIRSLRWTPSASVRALFVASIEGVAGEPR